MSSTGNDWHSESLESIYRKLRGRPTGLAKAEIEEKLKEHGYNELRDEARDSWLMLLVSQFRNPLVYVLLAAIGFSVVVGKLTDAAVIGAVIVINAVIGFYQEYRAEESLKALKTLASPEADVLRECPETGTCIETRIKTREIVPADVILLSAGNKVPADARLITATNLEVIESMLTGESLPSRKSATILPAKTPLAERKNMVYSGTVIAQGRAQAIVVGTGMETEIGRIAVLLEETDEADSPLKRRITDLGNKLALAALIACSLVLVVGLVRGLEFLEIFIFALATSVSAIPEGLPTTITIILAIGVNRMAKRSVIIRRLQAVETLGSTNVICTDKTGTLTTNQMTVVHLVQGDRVIKVTGSGYNPIGSFVVNESEVDPDEGIMLLLRSGVLCNDSKLVRVDEKQVRWEIIGDPTEGAIIVAGEKAGIDKKTEDENSGRIDEIPFDSKTKFMVTFHDASDNYVNIHAKGAPEVILKMCKIIQWGDRQTPITEYASAEVLRLNHEMANDALRVLAIATGRIMREELTEVKKRLSKGDGSLVFLGLLGMIDPPRSEAKEAVALCRKAGIRVIMATGDQKLTAQAIARELNIVDSQGTAVEGVELDGLSDEKLDELISKTNVFSRVSPTNKKSIVESLRRGGQVVAMTGDGVNDAPALKTAEIGVAMGISGTDVTKEAADMVITDDNFASIVSAVEEGRVIYENIRKVVKFLVSTNAGEIVAILTALILFPEHPQILLPVQILWINLVTDGLLTIPLAMEPKEANVMDRPPRSRGENIIDREIIWMIAGFGVLMTIGSLTLFQINKYDIIKAQTMAFATIACFQVFNSLNCRSSKLSVFSLGLRSNLPLIGAALLVILLQVAATNLSFFNVVLGTVPIGLLDWIEVLGFSSIILVADEIRKFVSSRVRKN